MPTPNYGLAQYTSSSTETFGSMIDSVLGTGETSNVSKIDAALGDKPDKVTPSVDGNIAVLDTTGNLVDGGVTINELQSATNELTSETVLEDSDYVPFYDTSGSVHKKSLWSNIISKIRTALFGISNGLLKSNGSGVISVATAGTDYAAADHNHNADAITDGTTNKVFTSIEKTKLFNIADNANNYTHPTTSGNKHIPSSGSENQFLKYSAAGTAAWSALSDASTSVKGIVQLSDSTSETSSIKAATPTAVKSAYNLANAAIPSTEKGAVNGVSTLDADGKVTPLQVCSKIIEVTVNTTISATHYGSFISVNSASARNITIPSGLEIGAEIEVYRRNTGSVTLVASGVTFECAEATYAIVKRYTSVVCKCIASNVWNIQGNVGVSE